MENRLSKHIQNPQELEKLYREDSSRFEKDFVEIAQQHDTDLVNFWKLRLAKKQEDSQSGFLKKDFALMLGVSLLTVLLAKVPLLFPTVDIDFVYLKNLPWITINGIIFYTFWVNRITAWKWILIYGGVLIASVVYINVLGDDLSDTIRLAILHLPLMLWCVWGVVWMSSDYKNKAKRMDFIRFNGEVIIMTGLILIAGGLLTAITLSLFSAIGREISDFYLEYVALSGAVIAPVVSYFLIRQYPEITRKVAPVLARVFAPVVLISLFIYLISLIFSEISILENREFLIIFNVMLIGVLAIIIFSVSELDKEKRKDNNVLILLLLAILAIIINSIALVAITSRLFDGLTPNRVVVAVTNILVFINLGILGVKLYRCYFKGVRIDSIEGSVGRYLTVYALWTVIAVFILPIIFSFQ